MFSKKFTRSAQGSIAGVLFVATAACSTVNSNGGRISVGDTNPNAGNPNGVYTLNMGGDKGTQCQVSFNSKTSDMNVTLGCKPSSRIEEAKVKISKAFAGCSAGQEVLPPASILVEPFWRGSWLSKATTLDFHPDIIKQPKSVVYTPENCFNYNTQAQGDSKPSDHGHSHGDDKPVISVPETSTGTTMSGPSSTPCGKDEHNHEHAHEVPKASSGQVTHFGCHRIDVPHTHDITKGNELSAEPHYPPAKLTVN